MAASGKRITLNMTDIRSLEADPGGNRFYPVKDYKGLCVQVTKAGVKSFVLRYRFQGRQKIHTLGVFPTMTPDAAKKAHTSAWGQLNNGTDPNQAREGAKKAAEEARRSKFTVSDLAERYELEHMPSNSKAWRMDIKRYLGRFILPALGKMPVKEVTPGDVSTLLFKIGKDTPTQANRVRAVLRTMFQRAEEWSYRSLGTNPVSVVKARYQETPRDRRLSDLELKALGAAFQASKEAPEVLVALRLGLLAGMRKGEIQGLRWEWVDLQEKEIRIPPEFHKTGKKTGRSRVIRLCSALVADLQDLARTLGCPYVIPGRAVVKEDKTRVWQSFTALQNPWERLRVAAKLAKKGEPAEADPGLHDLRRTYASVGTDLGLKGFVSELIGHTEQTVTDIYARTSAHRLQDAAEEIGARIDGILKGTIDPEKEAEARRKAQAGRAKKAS